MIDAETAVKQAITTVHRYLNEAVDAIDHRFGKGYARENPVLVAAFIKACAVDFDTWAFTNEAELDRRQRDEYLHKE